MSARVQAIPCCPPPNEQPDPRPVEGPDADEELAVLAKALGHPAWVRIIRLLVRQNACICGDFAEQLPLSQSTVSQHLKVLKEAGLIRGSVDGPRIDYCIEPRTLRRLKALMGGSRRGPAPINREYTIIRPAASKNESRHPRDAQNPICGEIGTNVGPASEPERCSANTVLMELAQFYNAEIFASDCTWWVGVECGPVADALETNS